jgi:hypothetical protein
MNNGLIIFPLMGVWKLKAKQPFARLFFGGAPTELERVPSMGVWKLKAKTAFRQGCF